MGLMNDVSFGRSQRQVLLIEAETLQAFGIQPGDVRENVTVEGLPLSDLAPSTRLAAGEAMLEVVGLCAPCSQVDALRPGLQVEMQNRRGILARVLRGGSMRIGDPVSVLAASPTER